MRAETRKRAKGVQEGQRLWIRLGRWGGAGGGPSRASGGACAYGKYVWNLDRGDMQRAAVGWEIRCRLDAKTRL